MELARVIVDWTGPQVVGTAVSVLHYAADVGDPDPVAIQAAFNETYDLRPAGVLTTVRSTGDVIEDSTGVLIRPWTGATTSPNAALAPATSAAGVGACVTWTTGGIVAGRRLRGRTFFVPLSTSCYDETGTLTTAALGLLNTWAQGLRDAGPLGVWHRPTTPGGSDGTTYGVTSFNIRDHVSVLGSRRS